MSLPLPESDRSSSWQRFFIEPGGGRYPRASRWLNRASLGFGALWILTSVGAAGFWIFIPAPSGCAGLGYIVTLAFMLLAMAAAGCLGIILESARIWPCRTSQKQPLMHMAVHSTPVLFVVVLYLIAILAQM